ncbi:MAG: hypothetical protein LKJ29_06045 [Lactobacillus sp.]|jgi:hypothetical protein|uniref:Uncharacterized protein n=1 Tax=Lacticaseibacillus suilingensis TaxID=2799577 RepID=A0ABW4BFT5_9LACO|nr:hypothetical protein [Lacticaseibacillus suilingensis]MCI1894180.1 hypothetical protein [Lactobacillus sp.]MCI1941596.1 hypothetical protein [Lactobacillus sp.]MCI1972142.1 hypothetical protein [Lactobacillus sp.]
MQEKKTEQERINEKFVEGTDKMRLTKPIKMNQEAQDKMNAALEKILDELD